MTERETSGKTSLLGVVAYVLVPGNRRSRAAAHFRKAGFEALKGVGALARPEEPPEQRKAAGRERIQID